MPPGKYRLKAFKGPEYRVAAEELQVQAGKTTVQTVKMARWVDLPKEGWYSAESHMHIARPFKELNPSISKWMQAEDIHIANLLQWGGSQRTHNARQYAHGPGGLFQEGAYVLASGQETPRTHFLGHTIIFGGRSIINAPDSYLTYNLCWEEARRQKALAGFAHFATASGARDGLAIDLLDDLLSFIEVIQFNRGLYTVWYETLNLGFRLAPIAGTDYPCARTLPGRERFYTRVEGRLSYESWLEGLRRGRTFATNGPLLDFQVDGKGPGDELVLKKPGTVQLEGRVRFDPTRDDVQALEVIENGRVVRSFPREKKAAEIRCRFEHRVEAAAWLALRASGTKQGEAKLPNVKPAQVAASVAHTNAVHVVLENAPKLSARREAKVLAQAWAERLDALEKRLAPDQLAALARLSSDGVDEQYLRKNREALVKRIQAAKKRFTELSR